jgi:hypothetical protein
MAGILQKKSGKSPPATGASMTPITPLESVPYLDNELPLPSPQAERILLSLFALGAGDAHRVAKLADMAKVIGFDPAELTSALRELQLLGYVRLSSRGHVVRLTLQAAAHIGEMALEHLAPEVVETRAPEEQAEALMILGPERYGGGAVLIH